MVTINKESLCAAFCGDLDLQEVPAGLAVRTGFTRSDGDAIGFYVTSSPFSKSQWRIEDSGLTIPMLEAAGVNLDSGTRADAFRRLLAEYKADYDDDAMELHSAYVSEEDVPSEAMRFMALMLRIQDLELLHPDTIENTFKEDATKALKNTFDGRADIRFHVAPFESLSDFETDALVSTAANDPVAVYLATSDARVDEAVMLWMDNRYSKRKMQVALVLEKEKPSHISGRSLRRAMNRLDATLAFRSDESAAMNKIASLARVG